MKEDKTRYTKAERRRLRKRKRAIRRMRRVIRLTAVLVGILAILICAIMAVRQGSYFIQRESPVKDNELGSVESETEGVGAAQSVYLQGIMYGIQSADYFALESSIVSNAIGNEEILIGEKGVSKVEVQRKHIQTGFKLTENVYNKATQIVKDNQMDPDEYNTLLRIVEAEATGEDLKGKRLIANVILNRVADDRFPDTIQGVVWQDEGGVAQFSPTEDGRIYTVEITEDTIQAVDEALRGVDDSLGALYFMARSASDEDNVSWFDQSLKRLFTHGGHEYYTYKVDEAA